MLCLASTRDGPNVDLSLPNLKIGPEILSRIFRRPWKLLYKVNRHASEYVKRGKIDTGGKGRPSNSPDGMPAPRPSEFPVDSGKLLGLL